MSVERFPVRFTGLNKAMAVLGLTSQSSFAQVSDDDLAVRMGWAFSIVVPRSDISAVEHDHDRVLGWGVHGWRGRWLVNGSSSGIVAISIEPAAQARVAGVSVRVTTLRVSVEDPDGFIEALTSTTSA